MSEERAKKVPPMRGYFRKRPRGLQKLKPKLIEFIDDDYAWLSGQADMRKISFPTLMDEVIKFYRESLEEAEARLMADEEREKKAKEKAEAPPPLADHHIGEPMTQEAPEEPDPDEEFPL